MVKVKICGITNLEDALAAVILGADAIGFVFYPKSPRYIKPYQARDIIRLLPKRVLKAGVFVNEKVQKIKRIARACGLDLLQLHGDEAPEFCRQLKGLRVVKAFRIKEGVDLIRIKRYNTYGYLFDAFLAGKYGGTGKNIDWGLLQGIRKKIKKPLFLSGGLTSQNVKKAVSLVRPDWVDVSSSVEKVPGEKDKMKLKAFVNALRKRKDAVAG